MPFRHFSIRKTFRAKRRVPGEAWDTFTETWFCPHCGAPAHVWVNYYRILFCEQCRWVYGVDCLINATKVPIEQAAVLARQMAEREQL